MRRFSLVVLMLLLGTAPLSYSEQVRCLDAETREHVRMVTLMGIDRALRNQTAFLFQVWMQDPRGQPTRATAGMHKTINAYVDSRANAMMWMPPICP